MNAANYGNVWKVIGKRVADILQQITPEEAVDCLKIIDRSGYADNAFWQNVADKLVEMNGLATDLESCISVRNVMLARVPDHSESYFTLQRRCINTIINFGQYKAQKLTRLN